jgi:hypothetical protein
VIVVDDQNTLRRGGRFDGERARRRRRFLDLPLGGQRKPHGEGGAAISRMRAAISADPGKRLSRSWRVSWFDDADRFNGSSWRTAQICGAQLPGPGPPV